MKRIACGIGSVVVVAGLFALTLTGERLALAGQEQESDVAATATRAAELAEMEQLRAEVAALQTQVAALTTDAEPEEEPKEVLTGDCGPPATGWGTATAGGVRGHLVQIGVEMPALAEAPAGADWVTFELLVSSANAAPPDDEAWVLTLTTCEGNAYQPEAVEVEPVDEDVAGGEAVSSLVAFAVPDGEQPVMLSLRVEEQERCQAEVRFPLTVTTEPVPLPPFAPCEGPTATAGVSTGTRDGGHGGDAIGGTAIGGDGCPGGDAVGGDAVGGDATGGDGGDGGDAVGGAAVGGDAIGGDCPTDGGS